MRLKPGLVALAACALGAPAAHAQDSASVVAVRELSRICIDTAAAPDAIRALAAAEGWQPTDPVALPVKNRIVIQGQKKGEKREYTRSAAWTVTRDGVALTIGLYDHPELPGMLRQSCELMAWDLDTAAVSAALAANGRLREESSIPGLPLKDYRVANTALALHYVASDAGSKMIHAFTVQ